MKWILDLVYLAAVVALSPLVIYRMLRHGRYKAGWSHRFGNVTRKRPEKKCIWIHAVSLGEVNATTTIVKELQNRFSDFEILISTTTDTGFARANSLYGDEHTVFYFPLDFSWIRKRVFKNLKPTACLFMELEVWPNFVNIANKMNFPVVVVNGRISKKSFQKYLKIKPIAKRMFANVNLILAQSEEYAERFRQIGCQEKKVVVTGSLKYDTAEVTDKVEGAYALAVQLGIDTQQLLVAGGTGPGEEAILLETFEQLIKLDTAGALRLVIVPRKPERFDEVAELIQQQGFEVIRYSEFKTSPLRSTKALKTRTVILGDTMGDLRKFYSLASLIFVGRTLVQMGGSDMMEAAALGTFTVFGPYTFNFTQTVEALLAGKGAVRVADRHQLFEVLQKCLNEPDYAKQIAANGQQIIKNNQGATQKTIDQIEKLLA